MPQGANHKFIRHMIKCSPKENERLCFTNGGRNGCPSFDCLNYLQVDDVFESVRLFVTDLDSQTHSNII